MCKRTEKKESGEVVEIEGSDFNSGFMLGILAGVVFSTIIAICAGKAVLKEFRQQAIQKNHAEWVVDQNTGKSEWRWKGPVYIYK